MNDSDNSDDDNSNSDNSESENSDVETAVGVIGSYDLFKSKFKEFDEFSLFIAVMKPQG